MNIPIRITIDELKRRMESGEDFTIIDVRKSEVWAESDTMIPQSIRVPLDDLEKNLGRIPNSGIIVSDSAQASGFRTSMIVKSSPDSILLFSLSMVIRNEVFIVSSPEPPHDRCRNLIGWSGRRFRPEFCSTPTQDVRGLTTAIFVSYRHPSLISEHQKIQTKTTPRPESFTLQNRRREP